jgi:hypothetical protein
MKNKILVGIGTLLGIIPVYTTLGWIIVYNLYPTISHVEKQKLFSTKILFGISSDLHKVTLFVVLSGLLAVFIYLLILLNLKKRALDTRNKGYFVLCVFLASFFLLFTLMQAWTML